MGEIVERGEVVVDLFSGIGYYSLPIMVHSEVEHVHCCEWNDDAIKSLEWGLKRNGISSGFTIHRGDNRETCMSIRKVAHRVIMGLLPTSEDSFEAAMEVLSDSGGVIHIHGLARPGGYSEWGEGVLRKLCHFREGSGAEIIAVNRIKSYAPRWDHIVLDVRIN
jgi:tRNA G37 N-methylase Trm5